MYQHLRSTLQCRPVNALVRAGLLVAAALLVSCSGTERPIEVFSDDSTATPANPTPTGSAEPTSEGTVNTSEPTSVPTPSDSAGGESTGHETPVATNTSLVDASPTATPYLLGTTLPVSPTPVPILEPTPTPEPLPSPTLQPSPVPSPTVAATTTVVPTEPPAPSQALLVIECVQFQGEAPRDADEYVRIRNDGPGAVQLLNWKLRDITTGFPTFTFPSYLIGPGEYVRVYTNQVHPEHGGFSYGYGNAIWNNTNPDTAELIDPSGVSVSQKSYPPDCG